MLLEDLLWNDKQSTYFDQQLKKGCHINYQDHLREEKERIQVIKKETCISLNKDNISDLNYTNILTL